MGGKSIPCVLDSGSQVTLIKHSVFQEQFGEGLVKGKIPWLTLKAANGLMIPYIGYALFDFDINGVKVLGKGVVVVEDSCLQHDSCLLGMNVIGDCWTSVFQDGPQAEENFKSAMTPIAAAKWGKAFAVCRRIGLVESSTELQGVAKLPRQDPVVIPPETEMMVWAQVPQAVGRPDCCIMVENLQSDDQEWRVARTLSWVRGGRVPVRVCNPHPFSLELPQRRAIAAVSQVDSRDVRTEEELVLTPSGPSAVEVEVRRINDPSAATVAPPESHPALALQGEGLDLDEQRRLAELLQRWTKVFAADEDDFGHTTAVLHQIPTGDAPPVRERYRPVPPNLYAELRSLLKGMLDNGVIKESASPWAAPVVLVRKKDGSWRFCVDYRKLNSITHKDAFPLPRIEESLTHLKESAWYSTLDLASGYWQVEVDPRDQEKTAFTTPVGLFQFERMPFGLCNAPATFQRLMQRCLGGQVNDFLLIYLDDVIVYSPCFNSHLRHLEEVFEKLHQHGLKLQPQKCHLFRKEVKYLGHVVSKSGVATDPDKTAAVQNWPVPETVTQVRSFLNFVGYYRRFIPGFSRVAAPINALLQGTAGVKKAAIQWSPKCQQAFEELKQVLLQAPVLAYADFTLPFLLYTDASLEGLGAVLSQVQGGRERVIAYASRSLKPPERNDQNYSSFKLELLALFWAITDKFKHYLWGSEFTVFTDNNPLVHLETAKLGAVEQRWVAQLANFTFSVKYRPGTTNRNADALSRLPGEANAQAVQLAPPKEGGPEEEVPRAAQDDGWGSWQERQQQDPELNQVSQLKNRGLTVSQRRKLVSPQVRRWVREWDRLEHRKGVLGRCIQEPDTGQLTFQLIVPTQHAQDLWKDYHKAAGHANSEKVLGLMRRRFYWQGMGKDIRGWTAECPECAVAKAGPAVRAPLQPIVSSYPWEVVALDYLSLGRPADTHPYILVMTDLFSRFAVAVPTKDQTAQTTANALWAALIQPFGCPERFLTDRGGAFESEVMHRLCELYGCTKSRTTPYHPQGNGACERFNRTLLSLLNTLCEEDQLRWRDKLPALVQAYNNTVHCSTGLTPYFVLFGRHARLPIDLCVDVVPPQDRRTVAGWVDKHHRTLVDAYSRVQTHTKQRQNWDQARYDKKTLAVPLLPGERVLIRNFRRRARGKLAPHWIPSPFVVISQIRPGHPVYKIRPEGKEGPTQTMHRNNLRPCPAGLGTTRTEPKVCTPKTSFLPRQPTFFVPFAPLARLAPLAVAEPAIPHLGVGPAQLAGPAQAPALLEPEAQIGVDLQPGGEPNPLRRSQRSNIGMPPLRYGE